jgi:hypothetical protein
MASLIGFSAKYDVPSTALWAGILFLAKTVSFNFVGLQQRTLPFMR